MERETEDGPVLPARRAPLESDERRRVGLAMGLPVVAALVVLIPVAFVTGAGPGEVLAATLVYGGLAGLAAAAVVVDRFHGRRCPRCGSRRPGGESVCGRCAYDLAHRPRFACEERHVLALEPGVCDCGRRLQPLPRPRGIGPEIRMLCKIGVWLLVFLLGVGLLLRLLEQHVW